MALGEARDEIKRSDELWNNSNFAALRTQQEKAFGYFGPYEFEMDTKEGKWDNVTTNSPKVIANKILGLLASSWLQLFIDVDEKATKAEREKISATEQLANGSIWLADRALTAVPSGKSLQSALSFFAPVKGGTVKSVYFYEDDAGKVIPDLRVYDPTFCQWIEGDKKLLWFCYRNYVSKYFIEQTYQKQIKDGFQIGDANNYGKILTRTFWDDQQWKVAINGEYVDEEKHNLGYIPVNIRSCGAAPYIQSEEYSDTMKWSWQNVFGNDWDMIDLESKLLTIETSKALESGKIKIAGEWDSVKSGGSPPEGLEKLGYSKESGGAPGGRNEIVLFDAAKGQKFGGMVTPPTNEIVERLSAKISSMLRLSNIDPIAFGQMTRSGSGVLAAELRAAALEFIFPFRKCVEDDFIWKAEESVRQFKNGQFGKLSAEGRDAKGQKFQIDISAKDVEEKHFNCHLVPDRLRDEAQELGLAIQKVQNRLSSRRTVMVKHNIVEDPDREIDAMEEEFASQDPVFKYVKLAKYYKDQGTQEGDLMAAYSLAVADKIAKDTIRQQLMPVPGEELVGGRDGAKPPIISPQAETARGVAEGAMMVQEPKEAQRVA